MPLSLPLITVQVRRFNGTWERLGQFETTADAMQALCEEPHPYYEVTITRDGKAL